MSHDYGQRMSILAQMYSDSSSAGSSMTDTQATVITIVALVLLPVLIASMWRIFTKAGEPGWHAIVPFLNTYTMIKVAGKPGWWFLLYLVPCVNYVVAFVVFFNVAKQFGRSAAFGVGTALLSPIFLPILAFGSSEHVATERRRDRELRASSPYAGPQGWTPSPSLPPMVGATPNTNPWPTPGAAGTAPLGRTSAPPPIAPMPELSTPPMVAAPTPAAAPAAAPAPTSAPASAPVAGWYADPAGSDASALLGRRRMERAPRPAALSQPGPVGQTR